MNLHPEITRTTTYTWTVSAPKNEPMNAIHLRSALYAANQRAKEAGYGIPDSSYGVRVHVEGDTIVIRVIIREDVKEVEE